MPAALPGENVDDRVADVDRALGVRPDPLEGEQQRGGVGLVHVGVLHRDEHVDVLG